MLFNFSSQSELYHTQGGRTCFGDIWIFAKFLIGLHRVLPIPLFKVWTAHIMYWNMITLNQPRFKVEPHSKYWYFCIERWDLLSLRFSENAVLFYIEWLCRKTAGNVNRPPYRYTGMTHWACPASSDHTDIGYSATTIFDRVTEACNHGLS